MVTSTAALERRVYAKVGWRLMPLLFACYVLAYLDRVNVGFAKLQMQSDLGFSDTAYGLGAGIFFIGYFLFEVPSNILLHRLGARFWIARIMILWGAISAMMAFVGSETAFYVLRVALGLAEAGFFPGIILYLTYWYTRERRARMVAIFMTAITVAGVFGGPISGWIMSAMNGVAGVSGWQWLFVLEGLPSIAMGMLVLALLDNGPRDARWLSDEERSFLQERIEEEERLKRKEGHVNSSIREAFRSARVWLLCAVYFGIIMGMYGVSFWLPQIVQERITRDVWQVGLISAIPWAIAAVAMVLNGRHSDVTGERRWHVALPALIGSVAFAASALPGISGWATVALLAIATAGTMAAVSTFWSLPTAILSSTAAAAGVAWINSVGNLAGYISPFIVGSIRDATHSMLWALLVLAASMFVSGFILVCTGNSWRSPLRTPAPGLTPSVADEH
jgi:D-galactonate transporter